MFLLKKNKRKTNDSIYTKQGNEYKDYDIEENGNELNKLKLRLRYSKALGSKFTEEEDEYKYVRSINLNLNIKSPEEYIQKKKSSLQFYRFT